MTPNEAVQLITDVMNEVDLNEAERHALNMAVASLRNQPMPVMDDIPMVPDAVPGRPTVAGRINVLCEALTAKHLARYPDQELVYELDPTFKGRRYYRIRYRGVGRGGVHAFVEKASGALIKAGTFKAPQQDKDGAAIRGWLLDDTDFQRILDVCDPNGTYLYNR